MAFICPKRRVATGVIALVSAMCAASAQPARAIDLSNGPAAAVTTPVQKSLLSDMQDAFTKIAATAEPFVVNIKAEHPLDAAHAPKELPFGPPQGNGNGGGEGGGDQSPFPREAEATGSGAIVSADGYIITNDHVVEGSKYVIVTLNDGREFRGKVASDHSSDLAVVKIDPGDAKLPSCTFADSDKVTAGQWAIAIGSPFDLQNTMTLGIISATHRQQTIGDSPTNQRYYPDLIQTDAAINPGNSGGPLIDITGSVVGINVAIESPVEGNAGVGFAIPANIARRIMDDLIKYGRVSRGYLGLAPADLTPAQQNEFGIASGAWVARVDKDSPAGRAGIHAADTIQSFDGKSIDNELSLRLAIAEATPGRQVPLTLVRNGQPVSLNVVVGAPPLPQQVVKEDNANQSPMQKKVGISVRTLSAVDRNELNLDPSATGAFVVGVLSNSPAERAGLKAGDVITQIGKAPIQTADDAAKALSGLPPGAQETIIITRMDENKIAEFALDFRFWE